MRYQITKFCVPNKVDNWKDSDRYWCECELKNGWERWEEFTLEAAIWAVKEVADAYNMEKITESDIIIKE